MHPRALTLVTERTRTDVDSLALEDLVGKRDGLRRRVKDADVQGSGGNDLPHFLADEVVHRLHVELGDEALLDRIDDRRLGDTR